jgi:hypothetical protein
VTESDDERGREGCMRARVKLDILKPLCWGRKAHRADGQSCGSPLSMNVYPITAIGVDALLMQKRIVNVA